MAEAEEHLVKAGSRAAVAHTMAHGRTVYAVESEQVPSGADMAAIFHHPLPKHEKRP